jgi:hypothetical protein
MGSGVSIDQIATAIVASGCAVEMRIVQLAETKKWHVLISLHDGARSLLGDPHDTEAQATTQGNRIERRISALIGQRAITSYGEGN